MKTRGRQARKTKEQNKSSHFCLWFRDLNVLHDESLRCFSLEIPRREEIKGRKITTVQSLSGFNVFLRHAFFGK